MEIGLMSKNLRKLFLFSVLAATAGHLYASTTGSLVIAGSEQGAGSGAWDSGTVTVYINSYPESLPYGQYSTTDSIASGIAAKFSGDPNSPANARSAAGGVINIQMRHGVPLNQLSVAASSQVSFSGGTINQSTIPTTTTTAISSSIVPSGYSATVDAQVSCNSACGLVDYRIDGAEWGTVPLDGNGHYSAATPNLAAGLHNIVVNFLGGGSYMSSTSDPVSFTIEPSSAGTTSTPIYNYSISSYTANSNVQAYSDSVNGQWNSIGYDNVNRLTSATTIPINGTTQYDCWTYDSFGNRLTQTYSQTPCNVASPPLPTSQALYNANNQVSFSNVSPNGFSYYGGNVTNDGVNQYLYDAEGRICAVASGPSLLGGAGMTQYLYDADGNRVAKGTINLWSCNTATNGFTETSGYVIGSNGEQVTEVNGSGAWVHTNVYAAGQLVATYDNDQQGVHFHLADWLGTQRVQTDYAGNIEHLVLADLLGMPNRASAQRSISLPAKNGIQNRDWITSVPGTTEVRWAASCRQMTAAIKTPVILRA
jgi:hypothetical protein